MSIFCIFSIEKLGKGVIKSVRAYIDVIDKKIVFYL